MISLARWNLWRDSYNPLRGLTLARAILLAEAYFRGEMADLQWTYFFIEQTDPDLFAIVERRSSAILEMDWNIKVCSETKTGFDETLAEEQSAALRERYERIDNLYDAVEHMESAAFRGFAHAELHTNSAGDLIHLELLDQWNVVRDGLRGDWKYNPEALSATFASLPSTNLLDPDAWVVHLPKRHVNRIALFKFIRQTLSQKDWDAFIEVYGLPSGVVVMPPGVPADKADEYQAAAQAIAEGGSGALPSGASYTPNDGPRGVNPFRDHLQFLQQQLVLAGTGGLLTMLAQSGSGTLAGSAHMEAFKTIARGRARQISETFQRQLDFPFLRTEFEGDPVLAYFEIAAKEEQNIGEVVDHVVKLNAAGFVMTPEEVSERTGYEVQLKPAPAAFPSNPVPNPNQEDPTASLANRWFKNRAPAGPVTGAAASKLAENSRPLLAKAFAQDLQPLGKRLAEIDAEPDPAAQRRLLVALRAELADPRSQLRAVLDAAPAAAGVLADLQSAGLFNGLQLGADRGKGLRNSNPNHDDQGKFATDSGSGGGGDDKASISDLVDHAMGKSGQASMVVAYKAVDAQEAAALKKATGLEVDGYTHALDNYAVRHILGAHGTPASELARGQVPVTKADLANLPEIIKSPDQIEHGGRTKLGRESIRYTKKIQGTTVVVEEVRTKRKQLVPVSMWKMKNRATSGVQASLLTSGTLRPDEYITPRRKSRKP